MRSPPSYVCNAFQGPSTKQEDFKKIVIRFLKSKKLAEITEALAASDLWRSLV